MANSLTNPYMDAISFLSIKNLLEGNVAAIRIKNFCPKEVSTKISTSAPSTHDLRIN